MPEKKVTELKVGEYLDCGVLKDGSHICVRRGDKSLYGAYEIVKEIPKQKREWNPVLDSGFLTLEAAKEHAWRIWGDLTGKEVKLK